MYFFAGATLKAGADNTVTWDPDNKSEGYPRTHKLIIKQCLLGSDAKADEYNVVEVNCKISEYWDIFKIIYFIVCR